MRLETSIHKLTDREKFLNRKMASQINNISILTWLVAVTVFLSAVHLTSSLPRHKESGIVTLGKYIVHFLFMKYVEVFPRSLSFYSSQQKSLYMLRVKRKKQKKFLGIRKDIMNLEGRLCSVERSVFRLFSSTIFHAVSGTVLVI